MNLPLSPPPPHPFFTFLYALEFTFLKSREHSEDFLMELEEPHFLSSSTNHVQYMI